MIGRKMLKTDRFPGGKHFAVTFSYDDGDKADRRLVEIFNRYGMKATFNLIPSRFDGETVVSSGEVGSLYAGHEIACHTYSHPHLERLPLTGQVREISLCRAALEQLSGGIVRGMATPYGGKNSDTVAAMNALGIAYCRNAGVSGGLSVPADFLDWTPSCHHTGAPAVIEKFRSEWIHQPWQYGGVLYIWGHSFEFDRADNWELAEQICSSLAGIDDVWYATNIEIYDYVAAQRALLMSADGSIVYNPSIADVWASCGGETVCIKGGETIKL